MTLDLSFNLPQFDEEYEGHKMRVLVEELERLHAMLTNDTNADGIQVVGTPGETIIFEGDTIIYESTTSLVYPNCAGINWLNIAGSEIELLKFCEIAATGPTSNFGSDPSSDWTYSGVVATSANLATGGIENDSASKFLSGVAFSPDGLHALTGNSTNDRLWTYTLTTPYDFENATVDFNAGLSGIFATNVWSYQFINDGNYALVWDFDFNQLSRISLSPPYTIDSDFALVQSKTGVGLGYTVSTDAWVWMAEDGLNMISIGDKGGGVTWMRSFTLSTAFDLTTLVFANELNFDAVIGTPNSIRNIVASPDGLSLFIMHQASTERIELVTMTTPWDVSTGTVTGTYLDIDATAFTGVFDFMEVASDGGAIYVYTNAGDNRFVKYSRVGGAPAPPTSGAFYVGDPGYPLELDGTYVGLKNDIGINWDDSSDNNVELLNLSPAPQVSADPLIDQVVLLMHFDDDDGSRTFRDSSVYQNHGVSRGTGIGQGLSTIKTAQSVFGGSSFFVEQNFGDHCEVHHMPEHIFGTNDWTIECRLWDGTTTIDGFIVGVYEVNSGGWLLSHDNANRIAFAVYDGTTLDHSMTWTPGLSANTFYHIAICRVGANILCFVDGVQQTVSSGSAAIGAAYEFIDYGVKPLRIGDFQQPDGTAFTLNDAYIDEMRITNGTARYTAGFTTPAAAFPDAVLEDRSDPFLSSVTFLSDFEGPDLGTIFTNDGSGPDPTIFGGTVQYQALRSVNGLTCMQHTGAANSALVIDNGGDGIDNFGSGDFTVEVWANSNNTVNLSRLIGRWDDTGPNPSWMIRKTGDTSIEFLVFDGTSAYNQIMSNTYNPDIQEDWIHIVLQRAGDTLSIWLNGEPGVWLSVNQPPGTGWAMPYDTVNTKCTIGGTWDQTSNTIFNEFNGFTGGVRITKGVARYTDSVAFIPDASPFPLVESAPLALGTSSFYVGDPAYKTHIDGTAIDLTGGIGVTWDDTEFLNAVPGGGEGVDLYWDSVSLLFIGDGADAQTTYTTEDTGARTVSFQQQAQIDTAQKPFAESTSSLLVDGTGDWATVADTANLRFGADDFTVECWVKANTDPAINGDVVLSKWSSPATREWVFGWSVGGNLYFDYSTNGTNGSTPIPESPFDISDGAWHHLAAVRSGTILYIFGDGFLLDTETIGTDTIWGSASAVFMGGYQAAAVDNREFDGWISNVRFTTGIARYTSSFAVPTRPYATLQGVPGGFTIGDTGTPTTIDGTSLTVTATSTGLGGSLAVTGGTSLAQALNVNGVTTLNNDLNVTAGSTVTLKDPTNADSIAFDLDGTDFNIVGTGVAEINLSGPTALRAGAMDAQINSLFVENGGAAAEFNRPQVVFSWEFALDNYRHNISSRHNGGAGAGNAIDVYTWDFSTDAVGAIGTYRTATFDKAGSNLFSSLEILGGNNVRKTAGLQIESTASAGLYLQATTGTADENNWGIDVIASTGALRIATATDADGSGNNGINITRIGTVIDEVSIGGALTATQKFNVAVTTVTATSYTVAKEYVVLVDDDTAGSTVTITLPPVATANTVYHIKKLGTTANVIIDGDGTETIDGALTATLTTQYESIMLVSNGSTWHVI